MLRCLLAALAALVIALPPTAAAAATKGSALTSKEQRVLREMNRVRAAHGLRPLRFDPHLQRAARAHSHEMLVENDFAHGAFGTRMRRYSVTGRLAGENLAWGVGPLGTARAIVAAWLASPPHRANLLRPSFRRIGVGDLGGSFQGYRGARVVTADFAG
jgi:uncharacterized protein YkwD